MTGTVPDIIKQQAFYSSILYFAIRSAVYQVTRCYAISVHVCSLFLLVIYTWPAFTLIWGLFVKLPASITFYKCNLNVNFICAEKIHIYVVERLQARSLCSFVTIAGERSKKSVLCLCHVYFPACPVFSLFTVTSLAVRVWYIFIILAVVGDAAASEDTTLVAFDPAFSLSIC